MSAILDHTMMRIEGPEEGIGWNAREPISRDPESCGGPDGFTRDCDGRETESAGSE